MERDIKTKRSEEEWQNFNSHAHVERDEMYNTEFTQTLNFNSHAHVERDFLILFCKVRILISTHTLTWSVTVELGKILILH